MDVKETGKQLATPEFKQKLASLTVYLVKHLGIKTLPTLRLVNSKENAEKRWGLTGYYDHEKRQITLYITGRHDTDILRSFSHECVHHWQNEHGTLHPEDMGINMNQDNHTGEHYAQNNLWLRKREMEAYLFGNLLFRDQEDEERYGPPLKEPLLPRPYD
jgi:hypothetical protein